MQLSLYINVYAYKNKYAITAYFMGKVAYEVLYCVFRFLKYISLF